MEPITHRPPGRREPLQKRTGDFRISCPVRPVRPRAFPHCAQTIRPPRRYWTVPGASHTKGAELRRCPGPPATDLLRDAAGTRRGTSTASASGRFRPFPSLLPDVGVPRLAVDQQPAIERVTEDMVSSAPFVDAARPACRERLALYCTSRRGGEIAADPSLRGIRRADVPDHLRGEWLGQHCFLRPSIGRRQIRPDAIGQPRTTWLSPTRATPPVQWPRARGARRPRVTRSSPQSSRESCAKTRSGDVFTRRPVRPPLFAPGLGGCRSCGSWPARSEYWWELASSGSKPGKKRLTS